ncbi:DUF4145 domain-containing protein [Acetobacter persici]|uniref:DUF4145 domain-containing protein n=1 Tax=Acetobacter persici TaxID=1076596 RepID=UPI001BAA2FB4|nr:DUF4145 domain-containing protein [Acetobacter persici]MBS0962678.1 DUF4145 domain-containing protein [Acetobacter persici]
MATETRVGEIKKSFCASCNGDRNCKIEGFHQTVYSEYYLLLEEFYILKCQGCDFCFFMKETITDDDLSQDEMTGEYYSKGTKEYFPSQSKRDIPAWLKTHQSKIEKNNKRELVFESLLEVYGALNANLLTFASIGIRTTFDIASEYLGIDSSLPFKTKIEILKEKNMLRNGEEKSINILVEAGNASAHRGWKPDFSDINTVMDILEEFIHREIFLPALSQERREREQDLQKRVPPRPKRAPKSSEGKPSLPEKSPVSK